MLLFGFQADARTLQEVPAVSQVRMMRAVQQKACVSTDCVARTASQRGHEECRFQAQGHAFYDVACIVSQYGMSRRSAHNVRLGVS